ncbi:MAG: TolC family protein [Bacteroidota bacterium]
MKTTKYFLMFLMGTSVLAQQSTLTLQKSLELGLNSSKEIKLSKSALVSAKAKYGEMSSNLYPQLSVGLNYNHLSQVPIQFNMPLFPESAEPINAVFANATIEQPLFMGFKLLSLKNAAEYGKEAVAIENSNVINEKALQIQISFWSFYKAEKIVEVLTENIEALEKYLKDTEAFLQNGLATKNDLLKLKVRVSEMHTKLIETKNAFEVSRAVLNKNVGYSLEEKTKIAAPKLEEEFVDYNYEQILEEALEMRSELKSNNYQSLAAEEKIDAANSTWYPQIAAFGSFNYFKVDGTNLLRDQWTDFWMVGLSVNWDIWDWWKTSSIAEQAQQQYNQTQLTNQILKENIEVEIYRNYLFLKSEKSKVEVSKLRIESAEENHRIIKDKYDSQMATSTELIDADNEVLDAKTKLITSYIDYKIAKVRLEKSIGRKIY